MQLLVPVDEISSDDRKLLTFLLDQCFRIFDRDQDGFVDRGEFVRGLQVISFPFLKLFIRFICFILTMHRFC
jgi:Ca2+-binding EF-hand superfamily protein